jgi:sulfopyruvate decarboxylase subunit beta
MLMAIPMHECLSLLAARRQDELVVTSAGVSSEIWWNVTHDLDNTFYLEASMSLSTMFAAGVAMNYPEARVWAFFGDGAFVMNPGALFVERELALPNLVTIVMANRCYGGTSSARLPANGDIDFAGVARAAGVENVFEFEKASDLEAGFDEAFRGARPTMVVLDLETPRHRYGSPPYDGAELKFLFGRSLERRFNRKVLP